jgi:AAA15 family ATPase/GTPase
VNNFKSFKDKITLNLAGSSYEFNSECIRNGIVSKGLIYGYNGVGKSNLGLAIMDIIFHLTDKEKPMQLYSNYCNAANINTVADFSYVFNFDDNIVKYNYGKTNVTSLVYEYLYINSNKVLSYNRLSNEALEINLPGTEMLQKDISKIPISVVKYLHSNAVINDSLEKNVLDAFYNYVDHMLLFWSLESRGYIGYLTGRTDMLEDIVNQEHFSDFKSFLKSAELPSNIVYKEVGEQLLYFFEFEQNNKSNHKTTKKGIEFFRTCSQGEKALTVFYFWLQYIKYSENPPLFVFMDEFDAFYHQHLAEFVIGELKKIPNCQTIITTHDTSIMSNDIMRPDCLFLMYPNKIRSVQNSTDKELRFAHNIEKMYRAGAFDE